MMRVKISGLFILLFFVGLILLHNGCSVCSNKLQTECKKDKLWVCLESISFNHDPDNDSSDAITIIKNPGKQDCVPEWNRGRKSCPAAYIKNRCITVKAVFSAAPWVTSATIGADEKNGKLGDIREKTVQFRKVNSCKNISAEVPFYVSKRTPDKIMLFIQKWRWYIQGINGLEFKKKKGIGKSKNKIYIVLSEAKPPWNESAETKPWADVLELSCRWAYGQKTEPGIAEEITKHLYDDIGAIYNGGCIFTGRGSTSFDLNIFIKRMPNVYFVNCYAMGKALVTFSNVLGCNLIYKISESECEDEKFKLNPIKLIGTKMWPNREFGEHAFGSLYDRIYDASLKGCRKLDCKWMIDFEWDKYKEELVEKDGPQPKNPERTSFSIGSNDISGKNLNFLKKQIEKVKDKYNYNQWSQESGKVISGVAISKKILPQIGYMRKMWAKDIYSVGKIEETTFSLIRKGWKSGRTLFDVTMIVCTTMEEAKKYLLYYYANWQSEPVVFNPIDIGNVGFIIEEKNNPSHLHFIRHNILIMMRAKGKIKRKMQKMARVLDNLLLRKNSTAVYSDIPGIPRITGLSWNKEKINRGESVCLHVDVENPKKRELHYFWKTSAGSIQDDYDGNFVYYGSESGQHKITVTVVNDIGLYDSDSINISINDS